MAFTILLYYSYSTINDPEGLRNEQETLCRRLKIKGRILISSEGINGTIEGEDHAIEEYMIETRRYPGLENLEFKQSTGDGQSFPRLRVVVRPEIVTLGLNQDVNIANKADYIEPEELKKLYDTKEEFYIIDARNEYEARVGKFKNAIAFDIKNFREFPHAVEQIGDLKDKPVITYCTGGVRCEKASAYLKEQGFENVRQLHGGVHVYSEQTGGQYFEGDLYVFDNRITMPVNTVDPTTISECIHCKKKIARFVNCCNAECNLQMICCEECEAEYGGGSSRECQEHSRYRPEFSNQSSDNQPSTSSV